MLREDVNSSDIISADGTRILSAGRLLGLPIPAHVVGIDLMSGVCALRAREGFRPYFLGAPADVLKKPQPARFSAIGTALGGKPRRLLRRRKQAWWTRLEGRGPIVRLSACRRRGRSIFSAQSTPKYAKRTI